jgi:tetratricopeptide (TPR) repeat protein
MSFSKQALGISREISDRRGEAWALLNLGRVCHRLGDNPVALSHLERALRIYREVGYQRYEGLLLLNLSFVRYDRGEYSKAGHCLEQALDIFRETGSRQFEGWGLNHMGVLAASRGEYTEAKVYYEQAESIFREIGDLRSEGQGLVNLGLLSHHLGDDDVACQYGQRALEIARKVGDRPLQSDALTRLGHALAGLGRLSEAADAYRQAADIRQELNQPHIAMEPTAGLACISMAQRDPIQAMVYVQEILEHLETKTPASGIAPPSALHTQRDARDPKRSEKTGHALEGTDEPLRIYLSCYRVLRANRDPRARALLRTAYDLLQERAANIDDEQRRRSFLENVQPHREIVSEFNVSGG